MDRLAGRLYRENGGLRLEWEEGCIPVRTEASSGAETVVIGPGGRRRDDLAREIARDPGRPAAALSGLSSTGAPFAFALWEPARPALTLCGDPLGLQPLYRADTDEYLSFGTRLLDFGAPVREKLHLAACTHFLQFCSPPHDRTLLGGVRKITPGERLAFPLGEMVPETLFPLPPSRPISRGEAAAKVLATLRGAVRAATDDLGQGDALGILLSGGLDSTALLALVREYWNGRIVAIHASAEGNPDRRYAREMADHYGATFADVVLTAEDARESLAWIVASMEAPGGNASAVANSRAFATARELGIRRVLSGLGCDEVFCGHKKHVLAPWWPLVHHLPLGFRRGLLTLLGQRASPGLREALLAPEGPAEMHRAMYTLMDGQQRDRIRGGLAVFAQVSSLPWHAPSGAGFSTTYGAEILQADLNLWLRTALAPMAGALAAANDVELNLPFCGHEMLALSADLPLAWKIRRTTGKQIIRRALDGLVPGDILRRPRQGFTVPLAAWLREDLTESAKKLLAPDRVERWYLLDPAGPGNLLAEHLEGRADWSLPLWAWMTFSTWFDHFVASGSNT